MAEKLASEDGLVEGTYASQLHFAVKENDVKRVRGLLQEGSVKVTNRDAVGRTPLHWAVVFGNAEVAKILIVNTPRKGLDARDEHGCTPLHYAAARNYANMARVLIERGASINTFDAKKSTPLHYAAQHMSPELVELLVSRGADKALQNVQGELPFDVAQKWSSISSIPCLRPDLVHTTPSDKPETIESRKNAVENCVNSDPVVEKTGKKGPSLEKLLGAWKAAETEARKREEAELAAAYKANATLEVALKTWREVEQAARAQRLVEVLNPSSDAVKSSCGDAATLHNGDVTQCEAGDADEASTSISGSASGSRGLSVETEGSLSCEEEDFTSCTTRDLSWCTEWEVQESIPEVARSLSPRERKSSSAQKEESHAWVQVWPPRKADGASSSALNTKSTH